MNKEESNVPKLNNTDIEVVKALLVLIANKQRIITYGDLSAMTKSKPSAYYQMHGILDRINRVCDYLSLPHISAMVVNKSTKLPGEGFYQLCIDEFGYDSTLTIEEIFDTELDKIGKCSEWYKLADYVGIKMPIDSDANILPEEINKNEIKVIIEGAKKRIVVNAYERDPEAKRVCKEHYMKQKGHIECQICGFNFGEKYGREYANMIHMHHIIPLNEIGKEYVINPVKDLLPVCPNCHMILHSNGGISVEELKKKLEEE